MFSAEVKLCIGIRSDTVVILYQYVAKYPVINWCSEINGWLGFVCGVEEVC